MDGERPARAVELEAETKYETLAEGRVRVRLPALDYRTLLRPRRRGEVAMLIERTHGWLLLQTKSHYPPGVFRLPTGTIHQRESADAAMLRELHEEANLVPGNFRRLFRLEYEIEGGRKDFFTDVYLIQAPRGQLKPNDAAEDINAWREAMWEELPSVAAELRRLEAPWQGWGIFRAVLHELVPRIVPSRASLDAPAAEPIAPPAPTAGEPVVGAGRGRRKR
jgi:8-oxo-dGTP pyrophosphatase MutT (NUDIX family)